MEVDGESASRDDALDGDIAAPCAKKRKRPPAAELPDGGVVQIAVFGQSGRRAAFRHLVAPDRARFWDER